MAGGGWTGRWESSNGLDPLVFFLLFGGGAAFGYAMDPGWWWWTGGWWPPPPVLSSHLARRHARGLSLSPLSSLVLSSAFAGGGRRKQSPSNQAHTPFVLYFYTLGREVAWARSIGEKHFVYWYEVQNR